MSFTYNWVALPITITTSPHLSKPESQLQTFECPPQSLKKEEFQSSLSGCREDWDLHYHLGGTGPWVRMEDLARSHKLEPPDDCQVDQVHMLSRHNERYPTGTGRGGMRELTNKLKGGQVYGDLAFVKDWHPSFDDHKDSAALTCSGCHCGHDRAKHTGLKLAQQYEKLLLQNRGKHMKIWASECSGDRVKHTAEGVAKGMFGAFWKDYASVVVLDKRPGNGANTLKPSKTCQKYRSDSQSGHEFGVRMLEKFKIVNGKPIAARLSKLVKDAFGDPYGLTPQEIYTMQEMCGYDTIAQGRNSPWCDVFTKKEWESFEYARDLYHFYRSGPGNTYSKAIGAPWMRATQKLLADETSVNGNMFLSFSHDSDITPVLSLLGVLGNGMEKLPTDRILESRKWRTSQVLCMGGRIVFERLVRKGNIGNEFFVRLIINDALVEIPGCSDGPGNSCSLPNFMKLMSMRLAKISRFTDLCACPDGAPNEVTFLTQNKII